MRELVPAGIYKLCKDVETDVSIVICLRDASVLCVNPNCKDCKCVVCDCKEESNG